MTLTALRGPVPMCPPAVLVGLTTTIGSVGTFVFNAADDKLAIKFVYDGVNIPDRVQGVITAFTSTGTLDATFEELTNGDPSGAVANSATGSVSISAAATFTITGMAGTAAPVAGKEYAIVLTATAGFAGNFSVSHTIGTAILVGLPTVYTKDSAGAWTAAGATNTGYRFGLANAAGTYFQVGFLTGAHNAGALQAFSDSTNPDERGNRWVQEVPATCWGVLVFTNAGSVPGANDDYSVTLSETPTTGVSVKSGPTSYEGEAQSTGMMHWIPFATPYNCVAGTEYGVSIRALGSEAQNVMRWDYAANASLGSFLGIDFYAMTRDGGSGNYSGDDDSVYAVFPIFSKFDNGLANLQGVIINNAGPTRAASF